MQSHDVHLQRRPPSRPAVPPLRDGPRRRRLLGTLVALTLVACSQQREDADRPPRHVLLLSLDTLRADHVGYHGYAKPTTPFLDELAERAVVFEKHFANANCTLPSHASMLTGLFTPTHGVLPGKTAEQTIRVLPPAVVTLAERLRAGGYHTRAITNHEAWLNRAYGFDQGFDEFESRWGDAATTIDEHLAALDAAAAAGRRDEKSFSFLHFFDIHSDNWGDGPPCDPYQSNAELIARFAGPRPADFSGCIPGGKCSSWYLKAISRHRLPLPDEHREYLLGLYDAGIAKLDADLRRLFEGLERRGLLEETLVVITSDHGEEFFEHEQMLHDGLHDEVLRVPLLILPPPRMGAAPRRVRALTQSTQLAPTLLELCGLEPIGQSPSLAAAVMGAEDPPDERVIFHANVLIGRDATSEFRLQLSQDGPLFYDRDADPEERHDLLGEPGYEQRHRERLSGLQRELAQRVGRYRELHGLLREGQGDSARLSDQRRAELEALGYF